MKPPSPPQTARDPRAPRDGALAGLVPVAMFGAWIAFVGWTGDMTGLVLSSVAISVIGIVAGWLVGGRIGHGLLRSLVGIVAYSLTAWFLFIPVGAILGTLDAAAGGSIGGDPAAIFVGIAGYALYALVTSLYVWIYLFPFGLGWLVTFRLLRRRSDRTHRASASNEAE